MFLKTLKSLRTCYNNCVTEQGASSTIHIVAFFTSRLYCFKYFFLYNYAEFSVFQQTMAQLLYQLLNVRDICIIMEFTDTSEELLSIHSIGLLGMFY